MITSRENILFPQHLSAIFQLDIYLLHANLWFKIGVIFLPLLSRIRDFGKIQVCSEDDCWMYALRNLGVGSLLFTHFEYLRGKCAGDRINFLVLSTISVWTIFRVALKMHTETRVGLRCKVSRYFCPILTKIWICKYIFVILYFSFLIFFLHWPTI
jgi:hypothetical protein